MDKLTIVVSLIGIIGTISSIYFAYLACKKNNLQEQKKDGKSEGLMLSDISYIKASIDRVEQNLNKVDDRYRNTLERLVKVEETVSNLVKKVSNL